MAHSRSNSWLSFRVRSVRQKCALIAAPFLFPIAGLLYLVLTQNGENIAVVKAELRGLEYLRPAKALSLQLATHRGLTARVAAGDKAAEADRVKVAAQLDEAFRAVDAADAKSGVEFKTTEKWLAAKEAWKAVKLDPRAEDSFQRHTDLIAKVLDIVSDVWEYSTLALDPAADTYYLQDLMIARAIPGAEDLGQLRGLSSAAAARGKAGRAAFTEAERVRVSVLLGTVESTNAAVDKESKSAARANPALKGRVEPLADESRAKSDAFTAKVAALLDGVAAAPPPAELFAAGTEAIAAVGKLYDGYEPLLIDLLQARASGYRTANALSVAGTAASLLAVALVALLVTRGITRQVGNLTALFERIEAGDYRSRAPVLSRDELGAMTGSINATLDRTLTVFVQSIDEKDGIQRSIMKLLEEVGGVADGDLTKDAEVSSDVTGAIADSFNYMTEQLRGIIGNVQTATLQVSTAATKISASAGHLASGSESQAGQIVTTTAAIDEMAVSIQRVSANAALSSDVAQQALTAARQGNAAVRDTIEGMNRIREQAHDTSKRIKRLGETSQEIGQIVQLIDDIADRTSMLALNASIQAAAAGDAGRGFAVVAEEVERLAVRSTDATKKIAALVKAIQGETTEAVAAMDRSISEVVSGSKVANQAGQSLQDIEGVSARLADLIGQISVASRQQAAGSEELARSMGDISKITRETATGTKQTADSVSTLAKLADELRGSVSAFKLPARAAQGEADGRFSLAR